LSYYPNTTGGLAYWASTTGTGIALNNKLTITTIGNAAEQPGINGAAVRCVSED
jgi:hypothetical protein